MKSEMLKQVQHDGLGESFDSEQPDKTLLSSHKSEEPKKHFPFIDYIYNIDI